MTTGFADSLSETDRAVVSDFSAASDSLLVAFGGIGAGLGMPPFEFFRLAAEIPTKKMFVRDLEQVWYQRGLPGISKDLRGTLAYLEQEVARLGVRRTVFVGNSMGAYAAIVFGWLLDIDVVHAFAPQTFIGRFRRLLAMDRRWAPQMRRVHSTPKLPRDFLDVKDVLASRQRRTVIHLHFSDGHRLDRMHCRRLDGARNIVLHPYAHAGHNLIKQLRDEGALEELLRASLRPQEPR